MKKTIKRQSSGITLIALVITIVVLLIIAAVSMSMLKGENGIVNNAQEAKKQTVSSQAKEELQLAINGLSVDYHNEGKTGSLRDYIFSEEGQQKIKKELENNELFFNSSSKTISYKNKDFSVDKNGKIQILEPEVVPDDFWIASEGVAYINTKYINLPEEIDSYGYYGGYYGYYEETSFTQVGECQYTKLLVPSKIGGEQVTKFSVANVNNIVLLSIQEGIEELPNLDTIKDSLERVKIPKTINMTETELKQKLSNEFGTEGKDYDFSESQDGKFWVVTMLGATIIFIVNGSEYSRIKSNRIRFPIDPVKDRYDFVGWYYDEEGEYLYKNRPDYMNAEGYKDANEHEQNKANEGDEVQGDEIVLYATFRGHAYVCLAEGTRVTLADGTKKKIEDITYEDKLLVWNFDEGKLDSAEPVWIMKKQTSDRYTQVKFENGAEIRFLGHRIFNVDKQRFTHVKYDEETPVGTTVFLEDGTTTKIVEKNEIEETVNFYNVISNYHINIFTEEILTSLKYNDIYDIENMKFIKDNRVLNKREDYPDIPDKYFYGLRLAEQDNNIGKTGIIWWVEKVKEIIMKNAK